MKIMCIGAHMDECEYGIGGVAAYLSQLGHEVLFYNPATLLHNKEENRELNIKQSMASAEVLGAKKIMWLNEKRERTWMCTLENVDRIQRDMEEFAPDILFIQWPRDNHPEHVEVARASYLALSNALSIQVHEVYAFEAGPDQTGKFFFPDFTVDITDAMPKVRESLLCYSAEHASGSGLVAEKEICARYRGHQNWQNMAEPFAIIKYPDGNDDFYLRQLLLDKFRWCGNRQYPAYGKEFFC